MISSEIIQVVSVITSILCLLAILKWWKCEYIPLHWIFFLAMMLGSLGFFAFHWQVVHGELTTSQLVYLSRLLFMFVLGCTSLMAISVLIYRK
jgi:hypothetical protein